MSIWLVPRCSHGYDGSVLLRASDFVTLSSFRHSLFIESDYDLTKRSSVRQVGFTQTFEHWERSVPYRALAHIRFSAVPRWGATSSRMDG